MMDGKRTEERSRKEARVGKGKGDEMKIIKEEDEEAPLFNSLPAQCVIRPPEGSTGI